MLHSPDSPAATAGSAEPDESWPIASRDRRATLVVQSWNARQPIACLALVHGLSDHGQRYAELARWLQQRQIQTTTIDLRGHGRSSGQRGHAASWTALQNDLLELLGQVRRRTPHLPLFVMGHSMGATIVLTTALERADELTSFRVRGLICLSPLMLPAHAPPAWKMALGRVLAVACPRFSFATLIDVRWLSRDPAAVERFRVDPWRHGRITARLAVQMFAAGERLYQSTQPLTVDCLLMSGQSDRITSTSATRQWVERREDPRVSWRAWPEQFHELCTDVGHDEVFQVITDWIESRAGGQH